MSRNYSERPDSYECRAVEVLTSGNTGSVIGYCLGGGRPGPNLLVTGYDPVIQQLFDRLLEIPALPWMWGQLYLINLKAFDDERDGNPLEQLGSIFFDETVFLPAIDAASDCITSLEDSFRTVVRACAGMGMIAGQEFPPTGK